MLDTIEPPVFGGTQPIAFWVRIICYNLADDSIYFEKITDINKLDNRNWLFRTMVWAFRNKRSIEVFNLHDDENFDMSSLTT